MQFLILGLMALTMALCSALMVTHSLKPNLGKVQIVAPVAITASTTMTTNGADTRDYESAMVVINTGAIAGAGVVSVKLVESDANNSDYTDVASTDYDVDIAPGVTLAANSTYRLGYKGSKRYIGVVFTYTSGTSIVAGATAILGRPHQSPVA